MTGLVVAAAALALAAPSAVADAQLPVGQADGVRIERRPAQGFPQQRRELVVVFTRRAARLYRKVAGKIISVYCTELGDEKENDGGPLGLTGSSSGGGSVRAPRRRRPIHTGDLTRGLDYCRVWLAARTVGRGRERRRQGRELIASVPLTQAGAIHLDEEAKTYQLLGVLFFASELAARRDSDDFPTPAELIAAFRARGPLKPLALVPLNSPLDTPPAGKLGYYSDGKKHAAAVILSAFGRRLLIEFEPDGVLRTNVAQYIYGDLD